MQERASLGGSLQDRVDSFPQEREGSFSGPGGLPRHSAPLRASGDVNPLTPPQGHLRSRDDFPPRSRDDFPPRHPSYSPIETPLRPREDVRPLDDRGYPGMGGHLRSPVETHLRPREDIRPLDDRGYPGMGGHQRSPVESHLRPREDVRPLDDRGYPGMGGHQRSPVETHLRPREDVRPLDDRGHPGMGGHQRTASGSNSGEAVPRTFSHQRVPSGGSGNPSREVGSRTFSHQRVPSGGSGASPILDTPTHFSHQRVLSGSSGATGSSRGGRKFTHHRELSGSSTTSMGVNKDRVTPRHGSSRSMAAYYDFVGELGKGSFGVVKLVKDRATAQERVCKTVSTAGLQPGVLDMVRKEVELLRQLDHPHVVKLFEFVEDLDRQELVLILEYVPGGSCVELLKTSLFGDQKEGKISRLICQVLAAAAYCHSRGVAHRDIKPEHMMLTSVGLWGEPNCKLIDFGLAAFTASASSQDFVGTPEYMAPEVVTANTLDATKTDIWSIGISTIELLTGKSPFGKPVELGSNEPVYVAIRKYNTFRSIEPTLEGLSGWKSRSEDARDFAYWLLVKDPNMRPAATQCLTHPWVDKQREKRSSLTKDMIRSMHGYLQAHALVRCCLFLVAARTKVRDTENYEAAFLALDSDCDGEISREDLASALKKPAEWWDTADLMSLLQLNGSSNSGTPDFDPSDLIDSADLDMSGGLSFTEFMATCLYAKQDSEESLAKRAFDALDDDRDGQVTAADLFSLFEELEIVNDQALPQEAPINLEKWISCFNPDFTQPTYGKRVIVRKKRRGWC